MTAIELFEKLLRGTAPPAEGSPGPDLRDILGGREPQAAPPAPQPAPVPRAPAARPAPSDSGTPGGILEKWYRESTNPTPQPPPPASRPAPRWNGGETAAARRDPAPAPASDEEEEAAYLIRAMINAARADGEMDREEEQKILAHLGQPTPEVIAFIRQEFAKPLDVREFAWSIPLGLEQKVYTLTLAVMNPDTRQESGYLEELAHGLRLSPDLRRRVHQQLGVA